MPRAVLLLALLVHSVLTFKAFQDHGYAGFFPPFGQANTTQIFSDLVVALSLANVWVFMDLRRRNKSLAWFGLHLVSTVLTGSFALMVYLLVRGQPHKATVSAGQLEES